MRHLRVQIIQKILNKRQDEKRKILTGLHVNHKYRHTNLLLILFCNFKVFSVIVCSDNLNDNGEG